MVFRMQTESRVKRAGRVLAKCTDKKDRRDVERRLLIPVALKKYAGKAPRRTLSRKPKGVF